MSLLNRQAIQETLTAELHSDGLLEVSNTDSAVIAQEIGVFGYDAARAALESLLGRVGRIIDLAQEGIDF